MPPDRPPRRRSPPASRRPLSRPPFRCTRSRLSAAPPPSPDPAPNRCPGAPRPASGRTSKRNLFELDPAAVVNPEAELGGVFDMSGLAHEALDVGIVAIAFPA